MRSVAGSFVSSTIAELLMTSIIQRILTLLGKDGNEGIKRIFDQGLNAAISGGINIKAYDMLVKEAPNVEGAKWSNHEEFVAQAISDVLGEILSFYYLVPLFGLNKTNIMTVMDKEYIQSLTLFLSIIKTSISLNYEHCNRITDKREG